MEGHLIWSRQIVHFHKWASTIRERLVLPRRTVLFCPLWTETKLWNVFLVSSSSVQFSSYRTKNPKSKMNVTWKIINKIKNCFEFFFSRSMILSITPSCKTVRFSMVISGNDSSEVIQECYQNNDNRIGLLPDHKPHHHLDFYFEVHSKGPWCGFGKMKLVALLVVRSIGVKLHFISSKSFLNDRPFLLWIRNKHNLLHAPAENRFCDLSLNYVENHLVFYQNLNKISSSIRIFRSYQN